MFKAGLGLLFLAFFLVPVGIVFAIMVIAYPIFWIVVPFVVMVIVGACSGKGS